MGVGGVARDDDGQAGVKGFSDFFSCDEREKRVLGTAGQNQIAEVRVCVCVRTFFLARPITARKLLHNPMMAPVSVTLSLFLGSLSPDPARVLWWGVMHDEMSAGNEWEKRERGAGGGTFFIWFFFHQLLIFFFVFLIFPPAVCATPSLHRPLPERTISILRAPPKHTV